MRGNRQQVKCKWKVEVAARDVEVGQHLRAA